MSAAPNSPRTPQEVASAVRDTPHLIPAGAGTKPRLSQPPPGFAVLDLRGLTGIVAYEPGEYTFTALAGTPLSEIASALARNGQHLPFDPPFADSGATLGGAIASGLSGPGRYRYGGLRDFILGVRYVTGLGELALAGGRVVKNAAGFDLPKLFTGSLGRLGVIVEASFKVFPQQWAHATVVAQFPDMPAALEAMARLVTSPFDIEGLELEPPGTLSVRIGGSAETFAERLPRLEGFVGGRARRVTGGEEEELWRGLAPRMPETPSRVLAKVPVTPRAIAELDRDLGAAGAARRYSAGGSVAWVDWPAPAGELAGLLAARGLAGLVIRGDCQTPLIGRTRGDLFRSRVKAAMDPAGRFPDF